MRNITITLLTTGTLLLAASGCTNTLTLGPKAHEDGTAIGGKAWWPADDENATGDSRYPRGHGASVTLPFIKVETKTTPAAPGPHREDNPPPLHHDHVHPAPLDK